MNKPQMKTMRMTVDQDGAEQQQAVKKNLGYCFVEFARIGEAAAAAKAGQAGLMSLQGSTLKAVMKEAWEESKKIFRSPSPPLPPFPLLHSPLSPPSRDRSLATSRLTTLWSSRPRREAKRDEAATRGAAQAQGVGTSGGGNSLVLHFRGARGPLTWQDIREVFETYAPVAHTDMRDAKEGEAAEGYVRFEGAKGARLCLAHMLDRRQKIGGAAITLRMRESSSSNCHQRAQV